MTTTHGRVAGKVAIITGAARGLGEADARLLAQQGAKVVITDVDADQGQKTAESIEGAIFLKQDVRDEARWTEVVAETVARFGRLDVLVNNAGLVDFTSIADTSLERFRFVNSVMIEGTFLGCKAAIPAMEKSGGGSIINVSSTAATRGMASIIAYTASKGAILAMTRSIADHCKLQRKKVRCNVIIPGTHDTDMVRAAMAEISPEEIASNVTNGTLGHPNDVGNLVVYLASDESRFLNGSDILIDGGETL